MIKASSVDEYIEACESDQQKVLTQLRRLLRKTLPAAQECISYGMPAMKMSKVVLWYAATEKHYGLYPKAAGVAHFAEELSDYDCSKGTIRFPRNTQLPYDLIQRIAMFCAEQLRGAKTLTSAAATSTSKAVKKLSSRATSTKAVRAKAKRSTSKGS